MRRWWTFLLTVDLIRQSMRSHVGAMRKAFPGVGVV